MAPLKKRRVVRQCSDLNTEDLPLSPKEDTKDLPLEEGKSKTIVHIFDSSNLIQMDIDILKYKRIFLTISIKELDDSFANIQKNYLLF